MNEQALQDRLSEINERLAEVMIELANRPQDGSYERQEKQTERNELLTSAARDRARPARSQCATGQAKQSP